jgi:hypothetical protein
MLVGRVNRAAQFSPSVLNNPPDHICSIAIDVALERVNRQKWITIAQVKVGETPSQPTLQGAGRKDSCRRAAGRR